MNPGQKIYVTDNGVRFRKSPETSIGAKLLKKGDELVFILVQSPWIKARLGTEDGWIHSDYIGENNPNNSATQQNNKWYAPIRIDKFRVTQNFLTPDPINYPKTGHHPGTDYGTQGEDNVPLYFCTDGEIIESGNNHKFFGNYFFFYAPEVDRTFVYFHLRDTAPLKGQYKAGQQCGVTGKTGLSFGIHLHLECMKGKKTSTDRAKLYTSKDALVAAGEEVDTFIRSRLI